MGKVNPQDLTESQIQAAARIAFRSAKNFFDNPENEKKFEAWKAHFLRKSGVYAESKETVENAGFFSAFLAFYVRGTNAYFETKKQSR